VTIGPVAVAVHGAQPWRRRRQFLVRAGVLGAALAFLDVGGAGCLPIGARGGAGAPGLPGLPVIPGLAELLDDVNTAALPPELQ
jgi:hypothetical protein